MRRDKGDFNTYDRLDDLEVEKVSAGSTKRLEFVLEQLDEADQLSRELVGESEIWPNVTVEELLGALIEADWLLEAYREQVSNDYEPEFILRE